MLKNIYRRILHFLESLPQSFVNGKTLAAENIAIFSKRKLYSAIKWTTEQNNKFNAYWKKIYGKKIPDKWHKLYQASSGKFSLDYMPEKIYSTVIEPRLNDRRYAVCLEDKFMVEVLSNGCGCVVPETILVCSAGHYYNAERSLISFEQAISCVKNSHNFVIKPTIDSSSGKNVLFFESLEDKTDEDIREIFCSLGKDFIIQKRIVQHPSYAKLNDSSINTIRITTFIADDEIHHCPIFIRVGRKGKNVDNVHAGGLCAGVEDNGEICTEAFLLGYGNNAKKYASHPDNNTEFLGYKLPFIPEIINAAYKVHSNMPHIGIISWDFSVDNENNPVLIEANITGQGIWASQMIYGKGPFGEYTENIVASAKKRN